MLMSKKVVAPRYRFQEFASSVEWELVPLRSLADKVSTKNKNGSVVRVLTNSAIDGVVDQSEYFDREIVSKSNIDNYFIVDEGDYVYNPRISSTAPVGPISRNKLGIGVMSPLYTVFRFKNSDNDFYEHYFNSSFWHGYIKSLSNTGARHDRVSITSDGFMKVPVPYQKDEEEQRKIAECLASLDELIAAEDKKLTHLKVHKKGLMQKLFPAEGETVPEWRFPEFKDSGDWKVKSIGKSCISFSGGTPDTSQEAYYKGDIPFIRSGEIDKKRTELFISQAGLTNSSAKMVRTGDVLVALYGANSGEVALSQIEGAINQAILCLQHETNNAFVCFFLAHKKDWITKTFLQGGQGNLSGQIVKSIELHFPKPEEQDKIVRCLLSLDDKIKAQTEKIEALKSHKKGLMQGLFPSVQEVCS